MKLQSWRPLGARNLRPVFAAAALTISLSVSWAQTIDVSGSAEVKVVPNEIMLSVGIETRHEKLEEAKRRNDERVAKVLAFTKESGVRSQDVQTDYLNVEPVYEHDVSRTTPSHYAVRKSVQIRSTNLDRFEGLVTGLLTNGVTTIHGIDFRTTEVRKHRDTARAMAIRAAREKADALATELGVKRGKVRAINVNDSSGWLGWPGNYWGGRGGAMFQNSVQSIGAAPEIEDSTLSIGQISISASVNVSFLIE